MVTPLIRLPLGTPKNVERFIEGKPAHTFQIHPSAIRYLLIELYAHYGQELRLHPFIGPFLSRLEKESRLTPEDRALFGVFKIATLVFTVYQEFVKALQYNTRNRGIIPFRFFSASQIYYFTLKNQPGPLLQKSAKVGDLRMVRFLLQPETRHLIPFPDQFLALKRAFKASQRNVVDFFLQSSLFKEIRSYSLQCYVRDTLQRTLGDLLLYSLHHEQVEAAADLLQPVNREQIDNACLGKGLKYAAKRGFTAGVKLFLDPSIFFCIEPQQRDEAVLLAAFNNQTAVLALFLETPAIFDFIDERVFKDALRISIDHGCKGTLELFKNHPLFADLIFKNNKRVWEIIHAPSPNNLSPLFQGISLPNANTETDHHAPILPPLLERAHSV